MPKQTPSERYYERNRDAVIARAKAQYEADPAAGKARAKARDLEHPQEVSDRNARYRDRHRAAINARARARRLQMPATVRAAERRSRLLNGYGITVEQYDAMFAKQRGRCAICNKPPKTNRLAVDHCHRTKRVRGLLCVRCNRTIGYFHDDPRLLQRAAEYLRA